MGPVVIEKVEVSLQARSKVGRYYGVDAIRTKLSALEGELFRNSDGQYYLRTVQSGQAENFKRVVIIFDVDGSTASVITQTSNHYDWSDFEHVPEPPFGFELEGADRG
ncbi:hypothetical protein [Haloarchaeobius salinus]|uniref:hypothetical protein n=1 Tax=Haloarchaeobius salinus TaxID=1198298 RepID=UPI00210D5489|nr:hypothetical protein [Haloarchaeobius salinus]